MPSAGTSATINLGAEYDDDLRGAVRDILRGLDAKRLDHTWCVGGSQAIETWTFEVKGETVVFEAETYIGLTVSGERDLVARVAAGVRERLPSGPA